MKTLSLLALFALLPCAARAMTITFGPQHSATYLDITFDISDGFWTDYDNSNRRWNTSGGGQLHASADWIIGTNVTWDGPAGIFSLNNLPLSRGFRWEGVDIFYNSSATPFVPRLSFGAGSKFVPYNWTGTIPTAERLSNTAYHITWDAYNIPSQTPVIPGAPSVVDSGSTVVLLCVALGMLGGLHRRFTAGSASR